MFSDRKAGYIPDPGPSSFSIFTTFSSTVGGARETRSPTARSLLECWSADDGESDCW